MWIHFENIYYLEKITVYMYKKLELKVKVIKLEHYLIIQYNEPIYIW